MYGSLALAALLLGCTAFFLGRAAAVLLSPAGLHSRPAYHGAFLALAVTLPGLAVILGWGIVQPEVVDRMLLAGVPPDTLAALGPGARDLVLAQIHVMAEGRTLPNAGPGIAEAAARLGRWRDTAQLALFAASFGVMLAAFLMARGRITPRFPARTLVERASSAGMSICASVALLTTAAILVSLAREAVEFFRVVAPADFLFGSVWDPQVALRADQVGGDGAFGALPVFAGTFLIAAIAMTVAAPLGLLVAIHLVEYARPGVRAWVKPLLEILAGVPTVVYGIFALVAVAPAVQRAGASLGLAVSPNSALAVGLVTGIMILPLIASLADDALRAVPRDLRDASLAMGATPAETVLRVLLPAAMPGILGGILLALSRAVGETMIVLMTAGFVATMSLDPLGSTTTVTVQIVSLLVGDAAFESPRTLAAYALGLILFSVTFGLNLVALRLVRRGALAPAT